MKQYLAYEFKCKQIMHTRKQKLINIQFKTSQVNSVRSHLNCTNQILGIYKFRIEPSDRLQYSVCRFVGVAYAFVAQQTTTLN